MYFTDVPLQNAPLPFRILNLQRQPSALGSHQGRFICYVVIGYQCVPHLQVCLPDIRYNNCAGYVQCRLIQALSLFEVCFLIYLLLA